MTSIEPLKPPMNDNLSTEIVFKTKDEYDMNIEWQRPVAWSTKDMGKFIDSLIRGYNFPPILVNKRDGVYRVIDGKNRLTANNRFMGNEFKLPETLKDIKLDGVVYSLKGKYYNDLDQRVKNHFLTRIIRFDVYHNLNDADEKETMLRNNSGVSMLGILKARLRNHDKDIQNFADELVTKELFTRKVNITNLSKEKATPIALIYTIVALECGLADVSLTNYERIGEEVSNNRLLTDDISEEIEAVFDKMNLVFPAKSKILSTTNIIPLYMFFKELDVSDERETFNKLENVFSDNDFLNEYKQNANRVTREIIERRADMIKRQYESV